MGSASSKPTTAPSKPTTARDAKYPYTLHPTIIRVKQAAGAESSEDARAFEITKGAREAYEALKDQRAFYVLLRGPSSKLDSLTAEQIGRLEPIGQVQKTFSEKNSSGKLTMGYLYTWPRPTGYLMSLRDIWKCTEFSADALMQESDVFTRPDGSLQLTAAEKYTVLFEGSAFTLDVADELAQKVLTQKKVTIGDFGWETLERRILRALNQSGKYEAWHTTLNPEEQRMFSTEEKTAALMKSYIKSLVRAWADAPKPAKLLF
jgi:hypothetical protein